jgi:hypothetical protein
MAKTFPADGLAAGFWVAGFVEAESFSAMAMAYFASGG